MASEDGFEGGYLDESQDGAIGVITIGNTRFATNLEWSTVLNDGSGEGRKKVRKQKPLAYARSISEERGADLVCSMNDASYGLGFTALGHKKGMRPLASVLASRMIDPFLAVFEVDVEEGLKGFYLVACRGGIIVPDCDRVILDENEARTIFYGLNQRASWSGQVVVPESWSAGQSAEKKPITEFVRGAGTGIKLQSADSRSQAMRMAVVVIGAGLVVGAGVAFHMWDANRKIEMAKAQREKADAELAHRRHLDLIRIANLPYKWDEKELGVYALARCQSEMLNLHTDVPGWVLTQLTCTPDKNIVQGVYVREGGTLNWIKPMLERDEPSRSIDVQEADTKGDKAAVTWSIQKGTHTYTKHASTGQDIDPAYVYLTRQFDELRVPVKLSKLTVGKPAAQTSRGRKGAAQAQTVSTPWYYSVLDIQVSSVYEPTDFIKILAPLKVLELNSVSVKLGDGRTAQEPVWSFDLQAETKVDIVQQNQGHPAGPQSWEGRIRNLPSSLPGMK